MPLIVLAGGEIVLALIAARIAWWIVRSGGRRHDAAAPAPDPSPTRHASPRRAGLSAPQGRRRALAERQGGSEGPRELAS